MLGYQTSLTLDDNSSWMKEALLICQAVAEVKTPDMGQVLGVLGNWELPVGPVRVLGELAEQGGVRWRRPGLLWKGACSHQTTRKPEKDFEQRKERGESFCSKKTFLGCGRKRSSNLNGKRWLLARYFLATKI